VDAFRATTDIGRAYWILYPCAVGVFYMAFLVRYGDWGRRRTAQFTDAAAAMAYVFAAVAASGIAVNIIKLMVGRARPRHFDTLGHLAFDPFAGTSAFASFPSGHAATAFSAGLALAFLIPRLRWAMLALASWVAVSRVAISVHYLTDIAVGSAIGALCALYFRGWFVERGMLWRQVGAGYRRRMVFRLRQTKLR
jgi:undecaprenyl-diphosphatase